MKAITIRQPWASLLVLGYKQYETRCWRTMYRGPLAIHAGKMPVKDTLAELMAQGRDGRRIVEAVEMALEGHGGIDHIPHGAIIAVRNLVRCNVVDECFLSGLTNQEYMFGDYRPDRRRYAWEFDSGGQNLVAPIPANGSQGLWDWEEGDRFAGIPTRR